MEEAEYSDMRFEFWAKKTVDRSNQRFVLPDVDDGVDCNGCGAIPKVSIIARTARIWTPSRVW